MPVACAGPVAVPHYWPRHHETHEVRQQPPVLNQWYTVFDEQDVEMTWFNVNQNNTEAAAKNIEVRVTVDGVVYQHTYGVPAASDRWIYRSLNKSTAFDHGMTIDTVARNPGYTTKWSGQAFKVEVRQTSAIGTAQLLLSRCVIGTDEVT